MGKKKDHATMASQGTENVSVKAVWSKDLLHTFCDICIKAVDMGMRPHTHFDKKGWKFVITKFANETGRCFTKKQLRNKWDGCKKDWKIWKKLLGSETGLGWNSTYGTVDCGDEWWASKIQVDKRYAKFRFGGIEPTLCAKFDRMYMNTVATGRFAWTPSIGGLIDDEEDDDDDNGGGGGYDDDDDYHDDDDRFNGSHVNLEEGSGDSEEDGVGNFVESINDMVAGIDVAASTSRSSGKRKMNNEAGHKGKKKSKRGSGVGVQLVSKMDRLVSSIETNSDCTSNRRDKKGCSVEEVMAEIHAMPDIDIGSDIHTFASEFFCQRMKREMWCAMGEPRAKLKWLQKMFQRHYTH